MAELVYLLAARSGGSSGRAMIGPRQWASSLFGPYLIGVELASMLLLAGWSARITWDGGNAPNQEVR